MPERLSRNFAVIMAGALLLAILAQIKLHVPFSPVPVTGQTFGVALVALLFGRRKAVSTVLVYLFMGAIGLPVFATMKSGLYWGPTTGYLVGMLAQAFVIGTFSDRGWALSLPSAWLAALLGSAATFTFGLIGLSFFVPLSELAEKGMIPFIPGDLVKTFLAALIAYLAQRKRGPW